MSGAARIENGLVAVFPGVDCVIDTTRLGLQPLDVFASAIPGDHRETTRDVTIESQFVSFFRLDPGVGVGGQAHEDRVLVGEPHVMRHPGAGKGNRHIVFDHALGGDNPMPHVWRGWPIVEEHELAGSLVDFGVGRDTALFGPVPVFGPDGFKREGSILYASPARYHIAMRLPL